MKDNWQAHVTDLYQKAANKKAEHDARKAESGEDYADNVVSFPIAAVQEAEYAVLDAALGGIR
jgi:hypothetical protein